MLHFFRNAKISKNVLRDNEIYLQNTARMLETTRFSQLRSRKISSSDIGITTDYSFIGDGLHKQDPHVQSYFGAMQSNVSTQFDAKQKLINLNMQWSQNCKFMSQNLQIFHFTAVKKNNHLNWYYLSKDVTIQNKDSTIVGNLQSKRSYCNKLDKPDDNPQNQSKKYQLKKAFKDYGSTVVIFHIAVSLLSLSGFYLLISSGINITAILEQLGYAPDVLKNNVALGASNFVIAYAVHKVFAPVRITITLGATPFIVRYLRSKGLLKSKKI